jgi:hypothetical protein
MTDVLIRLLLVLPFVDWIAAVILVTVSARNPSILTLRERAIDSLIVAVVATIAGVLALVRYGWVFVDNDMAILLLAGILVLSSMPSVFWLFLLVTGRFGIGRRQ